MYRGVTRTSRFIPSLRQIFQSTLPMRGVTKVLLPDPVPGIISIHTPHAGSDFPGILQILRQRAFQSTLPMRGVTLVPAISSATSLFQSTLPMRGVTAPAFFAAGKQCQFQSTLPMRGVTKKTHPFIDIFLISIHTPHAGSDYLLG